MPQLREDGPRAANSTASERRVTLLEWISDRAEHLDEQYAARDRGESPIVHVPTGIARLDAVGLLEPEILTVVGAHTGDGKSAFGLQLLEGAARAGFDAIGFFLEDPARLVADREIARQLGVSAFKLRRLGIQEQAASLSTRLGNVLRSSSEWAHRITVSDAFHDTDLLFARIKAWWTPKTKLVVVDYAQAFDAEGDEKSVERVVARLAWRLNELAKTTGAAVVLLSQVSKELLKNGRQWYNNWRFHHRDEQPNADAVEGFRPGAGDLQWSSALGQRAKQVLYLFRPGSWMRALGAEVADDVMEVSIDKGNFGPSKEIIRLGWDGAQARIFDPRGAR